MKRKANKVSVSFPSAASLNQRELNTASCSHGRGKVECSGEGYMVLWKADSSAKEASRICERYDDELEKCLGPKKVG